MTTKERLDRIEQSIIGLCLLLEGKGLQSHALETVKKMMVDNRNSEKEPKCDSSGETTP